VLAVALLVAAATGGAQDLPPELRTVEVRSANGVVVANTREAASAGARLLREGGNAVDAAVAAALALGVSEAEASGIGGNAWILIHLARGQDLAIDGSAVVPARVNTEELQRQLDDGVEFGYKTVAAPGGLAALAYALQRYGTKSFAEVVAPAIEIAEFGYRLPPHELSVVGAFGWKLRSNATLRGIFLDPSLEPWGADHLYCMDELAATLKRLAAAGAMDFYTGEVADAIDADMRANDGFLRKSDLAVVRPVGRTPLRGRYRVDPTFCPVAAVPSSRRSRSWIAFPERRSAATRRQHHDPAGGSRIALYDRTCRGPSLGRSACSSCSVPHDELHRSIRAGPAGAGDPEP
jgi:gamma-glutamyltranspeptidase/glutathione hydrolase